MLINLNLDLLRWIDAHREDKSRAAFIVMKLKEVMQYTTPTGIIHTKGQYDKTNFRNGANHAPEQD